MASVAVAAGAFATDDAAEVLAADVRTLKAELKKAGLSSGEVNRHPEVAAKVKALQELRGEEFLLRVQAERQEAKHLERLLVERQRSETQEKQRSELHNQEVHVQKPLVQRKIFHLFRHAGNGPNFHYEPPPRFNSEQCGFGSGSVPQPAVYITEKWDGTTMQATSSHIFKRLDLWGGKRKSADPSARYDLQLIAWRNEDTSNNWRGLDFVEADQRVADALSKYLDVIQQLDDGLCVYFEVVHTKINATYRHLPDYADLRVFDASRCGQFLPFEETINLAGKFGLPLVGWYHCDCLDAADVWSQLQAARHQHYETVAAPLEGFVIREAGAGARIAKARVEHLLSEKDQATTKAMVESKQRAASTSVTNKNEEKEDCLGFNGDEGCKESRAIGLKSLVKLGLPVIGSVAFELLRPREVSIQRR